MSPYTHININNYTQTHRCIHSHSSKDINLHTHFYSDTHAPEDILMVACTYTWLNTETYAREYRIVVVSLGHACRSGPFVFIGSSERFTIADIEGPRHR